MEKLTGRKEECRALERCMQSSRSEFVVLYGRRRIGKTFLVRSFFHDSYDFHLTGIHGQPKKYQLENFRKALVRYSGKEVPVLKDWLDAFDTLAAYLESLPVHRRKVLFIDEMPWIDTQMSDFVPALEYFWNSWVANRDDIVLVACGSATSWMKDKLFDNPGGLHNRITCRIYLRPFNLLECRDYLQERDFDWDTRQLLQCYMALGGVPFYLSLLDSSDSLQGNIDRLVFQRAGMLSSEFEELYPALFHNADTYIKLVTLLSRKREGMTRDEIIKASGFSGGTLTTILQNLLSCDLLSLYSQFKCGTQKAIYRLADFYTQFYLHFRAANESKDEQYWLHHFMTPAVAAWEGLSFEQLCMAHLPQIKKALGISGMATSAYTWRYTPTPANLQKGLPDKGAQIDLVIERADKIIHLCEIKFTDGKFNITKDYEALLRERIDTFRQVTGIQHNLKITFITPQGVADGKYHSIVQDNLTAEDLFLPV